MASPRVFLSSTCYDLREVRDGLIQFIEGFGFHPMLSEKGDVFFHPDMHTHDACLHEVGNCDIFLLIIGGRFGGEYKADSEKSIVNAEYEAARKSGIPVFTFIKKEVYSDHHLYASNREKEALAHIEFPSIEKPEYAANIFRFIDTVRGSTVNNGVFEFEYGKDIQDMLRSQFAGLFFDFLTQRKQKNESKVATDLLKSLSLATTKVEDLLENVYRHIDKSGADTVIREVSIRAEAAAFFKRIRSEFHITRPLVDPEALIGCADSSEDWISFLKNSVHFSSDAEDIIFWHEIGYGPEGHSVGDGIGMRIDITDDSPSHVLDREYDLSKYFKSVQMVSDEVLEEILNEVFFGHSK